MIGIFNRLEYMADFDILNKIKHKNNITKWKHGFCKVKFPFTLNFINFFIEDLNFTFVILYLSIASTIRGNRFHLFES